MRGITNVVVSGGGGGGTTNAILYYMTGDPDYEGYFVRATGLLSGTVYNTEIGADGNGYATVAGMEHYSLEFYYIDENDQEVPVFNDEIDANMGCFYYISIGYDITSWEGIQNILNAHKELELLNIGDEITANVGGVDYTYQVGAMNLYASHEVIFVPKVCIGKMNRQATNTNSGGWATTLIRTYLNGTFKNSLEESIKNNIKSLEFKSSSGTTSATITTTIDDIWIPREYEVFGAITRSLPAEQQYCSLYPIFSTTAQRIRTLNGVATNWWEAGATYNRNDGSNMVTTAGSASSTPDSSQLGLVPCFRFTANA